MPSGECGAYLSCQVITCDATRFCIQYDPPFEGDKASSPSLIPVLEQRVAYIFQAHILRLGPSLVPRLQMTSSCVKTDVRTDALSNLHCRHASLYSSKERHIGPRNSLSGKFAARRASMGSLGHAQGAKRETSEANGFLVP